MKTWGIALVAVGALLLGGCTNAGTSATAEPRGEAAEAAVEPTPSSAFQWDEYTDDELFIAMMQTDWPEGRPADAELIASAHEACDQIDSGADEDAVTVIGNNTQMNQGTVRAAVQVYCPGD